MPEVALAEITTAMGTAVAPVFLISGVGVLLTAMTTRYGRVIDRSRAVLKEASLYDKHDPRLERDGQELRMLYRRAKLLRMTIILAAASIFCVALMIFLVFGNYLFGWNIPNLVAYLFVSSMIFLIIAMALFIEDFAISLVGLKYEINTRFKKDIHLNSVNDVKNEISAQD